MEEWRPVVGYEGFYSVSSEGHLRRDAPFRDGRTYRVGKLLKRLVSPDGYLQVGLHVPGESKQVTHRVHKLVAFAFFGPRPDGFQIDHKDRDKMNCSSNNLEFVTEEENHARYLSSAFPSYLRSDRPIDLSKSRAGDMNGSRLHPERLKRGSEVNTAKLPKNKCSHCATYTIKPRPSLAMGH